jgi:CAAX protease family protein
MSSHRLAHRVESELRSTLTAPAVPEPVAAGRQLRRRRLVSGVFTVIGAGVLAWSLNVDAGSTWFYLASFLLAIVWTVGAVASGPLRLGRVGYPGAGRRPVVAPILIGLGLGAVFVVGAVVVRQIPRLEAAVTGVLAFPREGSWLLVLLVAVVNGTAEELFFRGALYAAVPAHNAVLVTTIVYTLASIASGNLMLGFAAVVLGTLVGLERRASGGVLAPILTHVTWSTTMLVVLPALFP